MRMLRVAIAFWVSAVAVLAASYGAFASERTTAALVNGTNITTANVTATVDVRAKSLGPGFCGVRISGEGETVQLSAPPFVWSKWQVLFSHIGRASARISTSVNCDTGALFQVRFFR